MLAEGLRYVQVDSFAFVVLGHLLDQTAILCQVVINQIVLVKPVLLVLVDNTAVPRRLLQDAALVLRLAEHPARLVHVCVALQVAFGCWGQFRRSDTLVAVLVEAVLDFHEQLLCIDRQVLVHDLSKLVLEDDLQVRFVLHGLLLADEVGHARGFVAKLRVDTSLASIAFATLGSLVLLLLLLNFSLVLEQIVKIDFLLEVVQVLKPVDLVDQVRGDCLELLLSVDEKCLDVLEDGVHVALILLLLLLLYLALGLDFVVLERC